MLVTRARRKDPMDSSLLQFGTGSAVHVQDRWEAVNLENASFRGAIVDTTLCCWAETILFITLGTMPDGEFDQEVVA